MQRQNEESCSGLYAGVSQAGGCVTTILYKHLLIICNQVLNSEFKSIGSISCMQVPFGIILFLQYFPFFNLFII